MGPIQISGQDVMANSSVQQLPLGVYGETNDGRGFRYAYVGAVATVPGMVYQGPAQDTTNQNPSGGLSIAAAAAGATTVTLTSSITLTKNALAGGYMSVCVTPGQGQNYKILTNTAVSGAAGMVVTLEDPIRVALTTGSKVVFQANPYNGIVVAPTTMTNCIVGVPQTIITANYYGWIQVRGAASCLQTGSGTCGTALGFLQGGTQGSLAPAIAGTPILARALGTNVTGEYDLVDLCIS
jgi:hypothetical protein